MQRGVRRDGIDFRFCGAQHVDWRKARRLVVFEGCVLDALPPQAALVDITCWRARFRDHLSTASTFRAPLVCLESCRELAVHVRRVTQFV